MIVRLLPCIVAKLSRVGMREGKRPPRTTDRGINRIVTHMRKIDGDSGILQGVQ